MSTSRAVQPNIAGKSERDPVGWRPATSDPPLKSNTTPAGNPNRTEKSNPETVAKKPPVTTSEKDSKEPASPSEAPTTGFAKSPMDPQDSDPQDMPGIIFAGAEGLPLVEWTAARDVVDKEVVVYGMIKSVGSSGPFRFLNFKERRDSKSFTIVVDERKWDISANKLRDEYDEKNILVRGKMELYARSDTPQIAVTSADQIKIVEQLPVAGSAPMTVGGGSSAGGAISVDAFAELESGLAIPELTRDEAKFEKTLLARLAIGDDPLAIFLTVPEEASERPVYFDIQRDERTRTRWEISFAARVRDAEEKKVLVAEIHLEDEQLFFNWTKPAEFNAQVNYLQNCLLQLKTADHSKTVILRKPAIVEPILLDAKKPLFREKLSLDYLPRPEAISVEILKLPEANFETQFSDYSYELNMDQPEMIVYFEKSPELQLFRLHHAVKIANSIEIESALQLNTGDFLLFNRSNVGKFETFLADSQAEISRTHSAAVAYQAPKGQITKHKKTTKELSKQLDLINSQVAAYTATKPIALRLLGQKMGYRVVYTVGDIQFDLVTVPGVAESGEQGTAAEPDSEMDDQ